MEPNSISNSVEMRGTQQWKTVNDGGTGIAKQMT